MSAIKSSTSHSSKRRGTARMPPSSTRVRTMRDGVGAASTVGSAGCAAGGSGGLGAAGSAMRSARPRPREVGRDDFVARASSWPVRVAQVASGGWA